MVLDSVWYPPAVTPSAGRQLVEPTVPLSAAGSSAGPQGVGLAPLKFLRESGRLPVADPPDRTSVLSSSFSLEAW